jgi:uroporphyrin-3 C-methyltransferase
MSEGRPEAPIAPTRGAEQARDAAGRGLAFLALVLALLALGGAGYVYYRAVWNAPVSSDATLANELDTAREQAAEREQGLDRRLTAIEGALADRASAVPGAPSGPTEEQLDERFAAERARIDASVERLQSALGSALAAAPPTTTQWKLAEAEYLLRVGIHRALMERDAHGAIPLFRAADDVIKDVDDAGLIPVRAKLADEIGELEAVERPDIDGAFVRLEVLKKRIRELPLRLPEYQRVQEAATDAPAAGTAESIPSTPGEESSVWSRIADRLLSLVRIRRHEPGLKPLLDPEEAGYLEMSLELALERAQLALLRDDPTLYSSSLDSASRRIEEHLDTTTEAVRAFLSELEALDDLELGAPLPDVSGSLRLLKAAARGAVRDNASEEAGGLP